jgi:hypothetical protein
VVCGIVVPIFCFVADPFVFRTWFDGSSVGLLASYRVFIYSGFCISAIVLFVWQYIPELLSDRLRSMCAGVMYAAGLFAFIVGVRMIPYTLFGLFLVVGALGLLPFLAAGAFTQNARNADLGGKYADVVIGALLVVLVAALLQFGSNQVTKWAVGQYVDAFLREDAARIESAHIQLRHVRHLATSVPLFKQWDETDDPTVRAAIEQAHEIMFGRVLRSSRNSYRSIRAGPW